jgi:hypothetical protein
MISCPPPEAVPPEWKASALKALQVIGFEHVLLKTSDISDV